MPGEVKLVLTTHLLLACVSSVLLDWHLVLLLVCFCCGSTVRVSASGVVAHTGVLGYLRSGLTNWWRCTRLLVLLLAAGFWTASWSDQERATLAYLNLSGPSSVPHQM